jgi:hypothetical protein
MMIFVKLFRKIHEKIVFRTITVIGDSHSRIFFHDLFRICFPFTRFDVCWVGGATVSGLDNPNSKTQSNIIFREKIRSLKRNSIVIFLLGEVDTGFVIWYRKQQHDGSVDTMLNKALNNYYDLIISVSENLRPIVISTPLPTIPDDNIWGDVADQRKTICASQFERTKLTLEFNRSIKEYCQHNGIPFLDLDLDCVGQNGLVASFLLNNDKSDHHYNNSAYARLVVRRLRMKI